MYTIQSRSHNRSVHGVRSPGGRVLESLGPAGGAREDRDVQDGALNECIPPAGAAAACRWHSGSTCHII